MYTDDEPFSTRTTLSLYILTVLVTIKTPPNNWNVWVSNLGSSTYETDSLTS